MDEIKKAKACSQNEPSNCANCELTDDSMENVTGGKRKDLNGKSYLIVTSCMKCKYPDKYVECEDSGDTPTDHWVARGIWYNFGGDGKCGHCKKLKFFPGTATGYCPFSEE